MITFLDFVVKMYYINTFFIRIIPNNKYDTLEKVYLI